MIALLVRSGADLHQRDDSELTARERALASTSPDQESDVPAQPRGLRDDQRRRTARHVDLERLRASDRDERFASRARFDDRLA